MKNIKTINNINLIGTAHVSKDSVKEVEELILEKQPKYICIELDQQRYDNLTNEERWKDTDVVSVIKNKQFSGLVMQVILASVQKKFATETQSDSGAEFKKAIELAKEINAEIILIDRNVKITLNRVWRKLNVFKKSDMIVSLFLSDDSEIEMNEDTIQELMNDDVMEVAFSSLKEKMPVIHTTFVTERDEYMANNILDIESNETIVVVIGKAHLKGISNRLENNLKTNNNTELNIIPDKTFSSKLISWIFPIAIVMLLLSSFIFGDFNIGIQQLKTWILWNSTLAALFTLIARGSLLSIITAFITAPIGAISPVLSVGMFVALSEAVSKKPTVKDMTNIFNDMNSFKGFFKNQFLKIIALFIISSLGGALGNIIGGSQLIKNLFF